MKLQIEKTEEKLECSIEGSEKEIVTTMAALMDKSEDFKKIIKKTYQIHMIGEFMHKSN